MVIMNITCLIFFLMFTIIILCYNDDFEFLSEFESIKKRLIVDDNEVFNSLCLYRLPMF